MGLLRGVARTAVIAGTASATAGRVQRRQQRRWARKDEEQYAAEQEDAQQQAAYQQPAPSVGPSPDAIEQLKQLGELHTQGVLTDEEFAVQKAKILGS
ncbi:MAG TPA: SHOCT domain-containing protein [Acidimicrobiales bacterium]|nr:SHOCT domain-containing protein [Acidimicrobiales bacterium]